MRPGAEQKPKGIMGSHAVALQLRISFVVVFMEVQKDQELSVAM
jgi:hypothetical protein